MAHAVCINGHRMWDGDGTPSAEAYRINFFRELQNKEPDCVIHHDFSGTYPYIYDCVDDDPGEDLDIWCCDACGAFAVFVNRGKERFDYMPCMKETVDSDFDYTTWEEYIAFRVHSEDYEAFHNHSEGKKPLDALLSYDFKEKYYVSPDKELIVKAARKKGIGQVYKLIQHKVF